LYRRIVASSHCCIVALLHRRIVALLYRFIVALLQRVRRIILVLDILEAFSLRLAAVPIAPPTA
jgi:hypothetical protein